MWWLFVKMEETDDMVTYSYGLDSQETTGIIVYDKKNIGEFFIKKLAEKDTEEHANNFRQCIWKITKLGFPDKKVIAIG